MDPWSSSHDLYQSWAVCATPEEQLSRTKYLRARRKDEQSNGGRTEAYRRAEKTGKQSGT